MEFDFYVKNAFSEYGKATAQRWLRERQDIEWRLESYPTSYTPEELLQEMDFLYRGCLMMSRRFKLIYYYDEVKEIVHVMDIWDTRMNPKALIRRIE